MSFAGGRFGDAASACLRIMRVIFFHLLLSVPGVAQDAPLSVTDIIQNVAANEHLYENIDVVVVREQTIVGEKKHDLEGRPATIGASATKVHFVAQSGKFRIDRTGETLLTDGFFNLDRTRLFDGKQSLLYEQRAFANRVEGATVDEEIVRPHMFLMRFMPYYVPLSTYLSGHEAMVAHPGGTWQPGYTLEIASDGQEMVGDLHCHIISVTTIVPGIGPFDVWKMWLAEDRNYIPVKNQGFTLRSSKTISQLNAQVNGWQELEPGIWMPMEIGIVRFDEWKIRDDGIQVEQWQSKTSIGNVSLNPKYSDDFFTELEIPAGVPIYTVSNKEITKVENLPTIHKAPWNNLYVVNACILVVGFAVWLTFRLLSVAGKRA